MARRPRDCEQENHIFYAFALTCADIRRYPQYSLGFSKSLDAPSRAFARIVQTPKHKSTANLRFRPVAALHLSDDSFETQCYCSVWLPC